MSIVKKKTDTSPADGVNTAADEATDLDVVMRKYDRESATRLWEGTPQLIIRILMAVFGLFCIGMTLFSKDMPEVRLTLFVGCIIIIGFLTYPASKHHVKVNYLPWYDVVLMVMDWMKDNGHIDEDQIAMVKYYEDKMDVHVGNADN